jgi:phospholipid transport system substrate-binding protein
MKCIPILTILISLFLSASVLAGPKDSTLQRSTESAPSTDKNTPTTPSAKPAAAPAGSPTRAIQDLEDKTDDYKTGANLTPEEKAKNVQIKHDIITGTFDIRELCRLSLDKHWDERSASEQTQFVNLMTQLLERKAILSKEQSKTRGQKYYVKYLGETFLDPQKTRARVRSQAHVPKEQVTVGLDYKLVKQGGQWKIFDVIVDDASLVDNYKFQFNSIITKHGYPELISRINKKLSEMNAQS